MQPATARRVSSRHDPDEREADRAADVVARGGSVASWSFSSVAASSSVQRQEVVKEKTDEEKKKEALSKAAEAAAETPEGKAVKEKVLADPLVKTVKDAVTSTPGLIATGALAAGGVGALAATGKALPFQPPEIPLDKLKTGLSAKVTYEGPVNAPTFVGLSLTYKEQGPKGKKTSESDKIAADIARLKAQEQMFKPADQKAAEKKQEDELVSAWIKSQSGLPGLKIPLVGTPKQEDAPKKEEEKTPVQPAPASTSAETPAHAHIDDALATPGRPLDPRARRAMEARFGYDFSGVRVHDDARAAATAASIDAAAFTVGADVVFASGRYDPASPEGQRLLAHELAHVVQQGFGRGGLGAVQRLGAGEFLSRLFGEGTFSDDELRIYLEGRDTGEIEDDFDSDNKARAIVRAWRAGGSNWVLTARRKSVLIREMLSGAVYDDDEQMILEVLLRSFNTELRYIFTVGSVSPKDVDSALDGLENRRLQAFFEQRFIGGSEAVLKGDIQPQGDAVPLGDDIERADDLIAPDLPGAVHEWTVPCVLGIFCTLAPDVITGLRTVKVLRFTQMDVDRWTYDGTAWTKETAHPSGFEQNEGGEHTLGVQRRRDCGDVASTLKHEVVHTGQPEGTRYEREVGAYTEAEQFAISYGLPGRRSLRRTAPTGSEEPDPGRIEKFVREKYGGPEEGKPEDVLVDHKSDDTAVIRRPDGSTYERPPKEGDVYLDEEPKLVGDEEVPPDSWRCPGSKT
ncbi:MAG TPA: DUF4157 domain-containing protein [Gaiellaceae bacterium]